MRLSAGRDMDTLIPLHKNVTPNEAFRRVKVVAVFSLETFGLSHPMALTLPHWTVFVLVIEATLLDIADSKTIMTFKSLFVMEGCERRSTTSTEREFLIPVNM
jgi:hypothetical protein